MLLKVTAQESDPLNPQANKNHCLTQWYPAKKTDI